MFPVEHIDFQKGAFLLGVFFQMRFNNIGEKQRQDYQDHGIDESFKQSPGGQAGFNFNYRNDKIIYTLSDKRKKPDNFPSPDFLRPVGIIREFNKLHEISPPLIIKPCGQFLNRCKNVNIIGWREFSRTDF